MHFLKPSSLYSNWVMLDELGTPICRLAEKRARWYLGKGLAKAAAAPNTIQLLFTPAGRGYANSPGMLAETENRCVACGATHALTKHHVVPSMYRRHFPRHEKDHKSQDVVLLCGEQHDYYERHALEFKHALHQRYGVPWVQPQMTEEDRLRKRVSRLAHALCTHCDQIPQARQQHMRQELERLLGGPVRDTQLAEIAAYRWMPAVEPEFEAGRQLVQKLLALGELPRFIEEWRAHFLQILQPNHLPAWWPVAG